MKQVLITIESSQNKSLHYFECKQTKFSNYYLFCLVACFALFITGCQKEGLQSSSQKQDLGSSLQKQGQHKKAVPFKAVFQTIAVNSPDFLIADVTGTGEGSHIGKSTFVGQAVFVGPDNNFTGHGTITAANGDKIFATGIEGPGPIIDDATGNFLLIYHSIITGGTGRFADATGTYTTTAHASIYNDKGTDFIEGTISY